jgi:hypothetical protein
MKPSRLDIAGATFATAALCGCGAPVGNAVEDKRAIAEIACFSKALEIQGVSEEFQAESSIFEDDAENATADDPALKPQFRFVSTGQFVVDYGQTPASPGVPPFTLKCTGDFNKARFTTVQVNGVLHRPKPGDVWPIDHVDGEPAEQMQARTE